MKEIIKPSTREHLKRINNSKNNIFNSDIPEVDINELFSGELGTETDILKELFNYKNSKTKSDLNSLQISIITRLYAQAKITQNELLENVLNEFIILRISKDRLSRKEFVESFKGIDDSKSGNSFISRFANSFKTDK